MSSHSPALSHPFHHPYVNRLRLITQGRWLRWLGWLAVAVTLLGGLAWVQFAAAGLPGTDGYYHVRMAALIAEQGFKPAFTWLPMTILKPSSYYDHHFLFHVLLAPYTRLDPLAGGKIASVMFAGSAFAAVWRLLQAQRIPLAGLWALGLLGISDAFLYRMSLPRAQSLSLAVLALGMHGLLTRRHKWLLALGFLYVWLYDAFPLLLALAAAYTLADGLASRHWDWRPLAFSAAGIGLGLLVNPYFPVNLIFIVQHLTPKLSGATAINVGNEWYPYETTALLANTPLALAALPLGGLALGFSGKRIDARTLFAFLMACLFGLMLFQSRRFVEYYPPFALIFAAFACAPLLAANRDHTARQDWRPAILLALVFLAGSLYTVPRSRNAVAGSVSPERYARAASWLKAMTPPGSLVFQTDWDDFPRLFYYDTHNSYLIGLDPTYLQLADAGLYDRWEQIAEGQIDRPGAEILSRFGARYVFSDTHHTAFLSKARADPRMREMYRDGEAVIYEIVE